ncbi:LPXTG cell wall anchor domain-containing protein [Plantibacter sp. CFBP 8798]|uniref:LPXTG cell wall anchor domain-containing protein n=1 Tax=Plantibacter sp. CFBP 8798 TaxID=2775268 RepID=UPI00178701ED|nr:LPXTG cell wall anchor domain-containing protein [Plantibacter sp. CFBP 8798]MBD8468413.1 LPXTG cell wall anchor domain-containing protein [Plantibacter sp. CFBP 8798]
MLVLAMAAVLAPGGLSPVSATSRSAVEVPPVASEEVAPAAVLQPPVFTSPDDGERIPGVLYGILGTGVPGATIALDGGGTRTAVVQPDGTWSVPFIPPLFPSNEYDFSATQTVGSETSEPAFLSFSLYFPPRILSPVDEYVFPLSEAPVEVAGVGAQGSIIRAVLDGVPQTAEATPNAEGVFQLRFDTAVGPGDHEVSVTEEQEGGISSPVAHTFTVEAGPASAALPDAGSDDGVPRLPDTGVEASPLGLLLVGLGGVVMAAAGWSRRARNRQRTHAI